MKEVERADLFCKAGSKDAVYHVQLVEVDGGYLVNYQNGRAGGTLSSGTKTLTGPVPMDKARKVFDKVLREKLTAAPPYIPMPRSSPEEGGAPVIAFQLAVSAEMAARTTGLVPQLLNDAPAESVEELLRSDKWMGQQKFDGERRMLRSAPADQGQAACGAGVGVGLDVEGGPGANAGSAPWQVIGANRSGLQVPLSLEIERLLQGQHVELDAEDVGGHLYVFDLLSEGDADLRHLPALSRHVLLQGWFERLASEAPSGTEVLSADGMVSLGGVHGMSLVDTALTEGAKRALLVSSRQHEQEGVVFKNIHAPYTEGRPASGGTQLKLKNWNDATCIVIAPNDDRRSVRLGLSTGGMNPADPSVIREVGSVTIPPSAPIPPAGALVEVRYLYAYEGGSLFQPVFRGVRTDLDARAAHTGQLKFKGEHITLMATGQVEAERPRARG